MCFELDQKSCEDCFQPDVKKRGRQAFRKARLGEHVCSYNVLYSDYPSDRAAAGFSQGYWGEYARCVR